MLQKQSLRLEANDQLQFVNYHRPRMKAGDYQITIEQKVKPDPESGDFDFYTQPSSQQFSVVGERFDLNKSDILLTYPPHLAQGEFDLVLPHLMLKTSTLPWSRSPRGDQTDDIHSPPWMALLVFAEDEAPALNNIQVQDLYPTVNSDTLRWPGLQPRSATGHPLIREISQHKDDSLSVIDVPWSLLKKQLPTYNDLRYMAHVRRVEPAATQAEQYHSQADEYAVLTANRLPATGKNIQVHLVSLEHRYISASADTNVSYDDGHPVFDFSLHEDTPAVKKLGDFVRQGGLAIETLDKAAGHHQTVELHFHSGDNPQLKVAYSSERPLLSVDAFNSPAMSGWFTGAGADTSSYRVDINNIGSVDFVSSQTLVRKNSGALDHVPTIRATLPAKIDTSWQHSQPAVYALLEKVQHLLTNHSGQLILAKHTMPQWQLGSSAPENLTGESEFDEALFDALLRQVGEAFWLTFDSDTQARMTITSETHGLSTSLILTLYPAQMWQGAVYEELLQAQQKACDEVLLQAAQTPLYFSFKGLGTAAPNTVDEVVLSILSDQEQKHLQLRNRIHFEKDIAVDGKTYHLCYDVKQTPAGADSPALHVDAVVQLRQTDLLYFNHQGAENLSTDASIRLVSLHSWTFTCHQNDGNTDFVHLLQHLHIEGSAELRLLDQQPGLGSQKSPNYLQDGYVPMPHQLRQGDRTISWYRGPLAPSRLEANEAAMLYLPAKSADDLMLYNAELGMFDASYAAAWNLGRTLALHDKKFAVELHNWKRARAQDITHLRQEVDHGLLPLLKPLPDEVDFPESLQQWMDALIRLEGVPFNYLLPSEQLLPNESLRFFELDPMWLECLRDGAFSAGRVLAVEQQQDRAHWEQLNTPPRITGFLLRSTLVSHFQKMRIVGYHWNTDVLNEHSSQQYAWQRDSHLEAVEGCEFLTQLRMTRLAPDLMMGLFIGELNLLECHLPAEILHFGLEQNKDGRKIKALRNPQTGAMLDRIANEGEMLLPDEVSWVKFSKAVLSALLSDAVDFSTAQWLSLLKAADMVCAWPSLSSYMGTQLADELKIDLATILELDASSELVLELADHILNSSQYLELPVSQFDVLSHDITDEQQIKLIKARLQSVTLYGNSKTSAADLLKEKFAVSETALWQALWSHVVKGINETIDLAQSSPVWRDYPSRVMNMTALFRDAAKHIKPVIDDREVTAGDFGLQMIDAAPMVRFARFL